ncbi:MAG TPA: amidohydrolase family protein [Acidisoma sp.]|nr:amidohydrolase family protein [Acidisoma sp.]
MRSIRRWSSAAALAARGGRILALGSDQAIAGYIGPQTKVLDLHGAFVAPGFIEGHGHLLQTGESLIELNVGRAPNWDAIVAQVKAAVSKAKPGQWIVGQGWQQTKWNEVPQPNIDGVPLPASLDAVSPDNPVMLAHASGHAIYVNAAALRAAGISATTPDPVGGSIVHDARGNPIGMLRDTAGRPVFAAYEKYFATLPADEREAFHERVLRVAAQNEVGKGITTFVDMGEDFRTITWLKRQAAAGLPLRLYVNINGESVAELDEHLAAYRTDGYADDHFTVRGVGEILSDGALGTRSAWNNAYAIFAEHELGALSPGKRADMVVISGNLLTLPAADILRTRVLYTIVGGRIVYTRPKAARWRSGQLFGAMPEFDHAG